MSERKNLDTTLIKGEITATSKKKSEKFKADDPTMTAYIKVDKENKKIAEDFGLTEYESKEKNKDGSKDKFLICKIAKNLYVYEDAVLKETIDCRCDSETNNFKTNGEINIALIKGEKANNDFIRITALNVTDENNIEYIEPENPFADMM